MFKSLRTIATQRTPLNAVCSQAYAARHFSAARIWNSDEKVVPANNQTPSSYSALASRLGIEFSDPLLLQQVLTHKSYDHARVPTNERLEWLGSKVLDVYVTEYLDAKYPNIHTTALQDIHAIHFGIAALSNLGKYLGLQHLVRWKPATSTPNATIGQTKVVAKAVKALIGAIYRDRGSVEAKKFIHHYLLSRPLDVSVALKLDQPKRLLLALTKRKGMERPVARLLKETGRFTNSPVFIVGVFSGTQKIGEGFGSSLKMAEFRAAKDALIKYYTNEVKDISLPSQTEEEGDLTFFPQKIADTPAYL
ncbi:54S ribosomal protein L3 mitochondrial [Spiromyces aspiralis]|uniref:54S ribosomal protein L3 mitochondrial n=1 Tax=Spiromyces aspiralis TaxID=68401 RepID=A0ACC1HV78_9FUNG|nr:54S ribosomal protein L3 mitochondrial [Spiromyces aspiralis]